MKPPDAPDCCPTGERRPRVGAKARERAVALFRALSDPTRLEIFTLIAARPEPICVCDIVGQFELRQPTISHHLKVLREAGLVSATRRGTWSYYVAEPRGVAAARRTIAAVFPEESLASK